MNMHLPESYRLLHGEVEFEWKNAVTGEIVKRQREHNIIKIFAKEILAHRIPYSKVWDSTGGGGTGGWIDNVNYDEFAPKYIVFGASFDESGNPLDTSDTRYYTADSIAGGYVPKTIGPGAEFDGGLINAVPIAEPTRPLKRIERIYFEPTYQPAGTPFLEDDVRAINNILVLETTIEKEEYNGFGLTASDYLTITEVALVGAAEVDNVGACECDPRDIFLTGDANSVPLLASANGTTTISLDPSVVDVDLIQEGDQIKIVEPGSTASADNIVNQLNPYYLVISKLTGGHDIQLDRIPKDVDNVAMSGAIGVFRDGFRIFSHRILKSPVRKSSDIILTCRWRIIFN